MESGTEYADYYVIPGAPDSLLPILDSAEAFFGLLLVPLLIIEIFRLWRSGRLTWHRSSGMLTSLFCLVLTIGVEVVALGALFTLVYSVYSFALVAIPTTWVTFLICFVAVDFFYYWEHRLGHEINGLWALYHSVHHSGDHFDQTIAVRASVLDFLITPLFYLPLILIGFHPLLVLTCWAVNLAWQQWIHTEVVGRLPLLDPWLNTPSNHRVHHARNEQYLDKNYGGVFMLWDKMFGSYEAEDEKVDYGLVKQLNSRNPLAVQFYGIGRMLGALKQASSMKDVLRVLFGKPEHQVL